MVNCIALGRVGDEMMRRTKIVFGLSLVASLVSGFYIGSNLNLWMYYNDDDDVKKSIYHSAIDGIVAAGPARDGPTLRRNLLAMRPDFFRSKEYDCVRFMAKYGQYSFIWVFCRNRADGTLKISNY